MRARAGVASSRSFASINLQDDAADVAASPAQQLCTPLTDGTVDVAPAISAALDMRALCDVAAQPAPSVASGAEAASFLIPSVTETGVELATMDLWRNTQLAIEGMDYLHMASGLPWWATIAGATCALRLLMVPLAIKTIRNGVALAHAQPHLMKLRDQMAAKPPSTPAENKMWANKQKEVMTKYKCNPLRSLAMPLVQMPVFMTMFFGLREMGDLYPSMATGGTAWFTDLTVHDPYYALPIISSLTFLAIIEVGAEGAAQTSQSGTMKKFMRGLALIMIPATCQFPAGVFMYWVTSNFFSLSQTALLKIPALKKALDIGDPPKPAPGTETKNPFSQLIKMAKDQAEDSKELNAPPPPPPVQATFAHRPKKRTRKKRR